MWNVIFSRLNNRLTGSTETCSQPSNFVLKPNLQSRLHQHFSCPDSLSPTCPPPLSLPWYSPPTCRSPRCQLERGWLFIRLCRQTVNSPKTSDLTITELKIVSVHRPWICVTTLSARRLINTTPLYLCWALVRSHIKETKHCDNFTSHKPQRQQAPFRAPGNSSCVVVAARFCTCFVF